MRRVGLGPTPSCARVASRRATSRRACSLQPASARSFSKGLTKWPCVPRRYWTKRAASGTCPFGCSSGVRQSECSGVLPRISFFTTILKPFGMSWKIACRSASSSACSPSLPLQHHLRNDLPSYPFSVSYVCFFFFF